MNAIELWNLTRLMLNDKPHWKICLREDPTQMNTSEQTTATTITESSSPQTYRLLCNLLRAAAEKLAAPLSKTIMINLEKRLERREKCQNLETLLVGVILLSCVEKMSWLFSTFKSDEEYPLSNPPEHYTNQAATFASFIGKLFKVRGIGLQIYADPETGVLQMKDGDEATKQWLKGLKLTEEALREKMESECDSEDVGGVEGRFWGRLLLPLK